MRLLLLLLLLLVAAACAWWACAGGGAGGGCPLRGGSCDHVPLLLSENLGVADPVAIPLHYHLGVFELDLWLGDQPLRAVFDTGSERLIVASDSCVDQHLCNDESGVYHVPATAAVRRKSTISYGTQKDKVRWLGEELALPHAGAVPCHQLYDTPGRTTRVLRRALAQADGNATRAAKALGIGRATLYRRMEKVGLARG